MTVRFRVLVIVAIDVKVVDLVTSAVLVTEYVSVDVLTRIFCLVVVETFGVNVRVTAFVEMSLTYSVKVTGT